MKKALQATWLIAMCPFLWVTFLLYMLMILISMGPKDARLFWDNNI